MTAESLESMGGGGAQGSLRHALDLWSMHGGIHCLHPKTSVGQGRQGNNPPSQVHPLNTIHRQKESFASGMP